MLYHNGTYQECVAVGVDILAILSGSFSRYTTVHVLSCHKNILIAATFYGGLTIEADPSTTVPKGGSVVVSCSGVLRHYSLMNPGLSITWYHNEVVLSNKASIIITSLGWLKHFSQTLTINSLTTSSVGSYRCVAEVDGNTKENSLVLQIKGKIITTKCNQQFYL